MFRYIHGCEDVVDVTPDSMATITIDVADMALRIDAPRARSMKRIKRGGVRASANVETRGAEPRRGLDSREYSGVSPDGTSRRTPARELPPIAPRVGRE